MGHWSEKMVGEFATRVGGGPDVDEVRSAVRLAAEQIEVLAGRRFGAAGQRSESISSGGLPFVEVPDLHPDSVDATTAVYPIRDPVNPSLASVVQVAPLAEPARSAAPTGVALWIAGQLVAEAASTGRLTRDFVIHQLGNIEHDARIEFFRSLMDPLNRIVLPVLATEAAGWWFQITRRLIWVTTETPDEGRLLEPLFGPDSESPNGLAVYEAVLVAVRLTEQPPTWAFTARIWPEEVQQPFDRPWHSIANAIHRYGVPVITVDPVSTSMEVACQVVMLALWHGYIGNDEPGLASALARAYPKQVNKVLTGTEAADAEAAAATLLRGLLRPGFDPARGAEATRRYVWRKASIAVMEHKKEERPDLQPWTRIGVSERRFYKLLPLFARKESGRFVYDRARVEREMGTLVDTREAARARRALLIDHLMAQGFSRSNARKWLQRHPPEKALWARPRAARGQGGRQAPAAR